MMSFLLISVASPKARFPLGMGTMVGLLFLEKAYLENHNTHNPPLFIQQGEMDLVLNALQITCF